MNSLFPLGMMNEDDCENKPAREDNSVGELTDEEITLCGRDALLKIPLISSAGDGLPLLVILNLLRIEFLFVRGKKFVGG